MVTGVVPEALPLTPHPLELLPAEETECASGGFVLAVISLDNESYDQATAKELAA